MKTIIVGGTRGIGKTITKIINKRGDDYVTLSRRKKIHNHIQFDLLNFEKSLNNLNKIKKIDNLIFTQRYRGKNNVEDFKVIVEATKNIINYFKNKFNKNGSIVILSSISVITVVPDQDIDYHLTRGALEQMVRYFAVELGPKNIRVNCVMPTKIIKPENQDFFLKKQNSVTKMMKKITPLSRMGTSHDIAYLVEFLTSKKSSFITGMSFPMDGGSRLMNQEAIAKKFYKK